MARRVLALLTAGLLAVLLAACGHDSADFSGRALQHPYEVPDVTFTDTSGQPYSLASSTDKRLTLAFFGYVRCEDICPAVLNHLASAMTRLDSADRDRVDVVFITTDPQHDTDASIRSYLDRFDRDFIGVRADIDTTIAVGRKLGVGIDRSDPGGHTTYIYGIDKTDEVPVFWDAGTSPAEFAADIHTLLNGS